jgi:pteridine reductase
MKLDGRVALVTGSGKRLGRAIAEGLAGRGARLAVHYNGSREGADELVAAVRDAGGDARAFHADLSDADAPARLVAEVAQAFGGLDVLVNSASSFVSARVGGVTVDDWELTFSVNLRAAFFATQAAASVMADRGGVVINLADHLVHERWPQFVVHGIAKAGVVQMTEALAVHLAPHIRVNAVAPGAVLPPDDASPENLARLARTTPLGRLGSPDDVVQAIIYLIEADYVTGETLVVDGGRRVRG